MKLDFTAGCLRVMHLYHGGTGEARFGLYETFDFMARNALRMHELYVRPEHAVAVEHTHDARAGMHCNGQDEMANGFELPPQNIDGNDAARIGNGRAQRCSKSQQAAIAGPVALDAREVVEIHRIGKCEILPPAVGEMCAYACRTKRIHFRIGVMGRSNIMRPVVHRGDARRERLGNAEPDRAARVLG